MSVKAKTLTTLCFIFTAAISVTAGYFYGSLERTRIDSERVAQEQQAAFEEASTEELNSIYRLLTAAAFTNRTNMNLSAKTNHYITHPQGKEGHRPSVACDQCWEHLENVVKNMPQMDDANEAYFKAFYRKPYEQLKKMRKENKK